MGFLDKLFGLFGDGHLVVGELKTLILKFLDFSECFFVAFAVFVGRQVRVLFFF